MIILFDKNQDFKNVLKDIFKCFCKILCKGINHIECKEANKEALKK